MNDAEETQAFARLTLARDTADAAARQLIELSDNPETMRKAAEAFADIAEIFTRWQKRAKEVYRPGDRPALMRAVMRNDPEKVAALIEAGVPLDERDEGETALHWAVSRRYVEIVAMLVKAGADPNVADNDGCTPLDDVAGMEDCPEAKVMRAALLAAVQGEPADVAEGSRARRAADDFDAIRARMGELRGPIRRGD